MLVIEMQHEGSLPTNTSQMDANNVLEDPAGRRVLDGLPVLVGEGRLVVLERLAKEAACNPCAKVVRACWAAAAQAKAVRQSC